MFGERRGGFRSRQDAEASIENYPVNGRVPVYFNPANPAQASLQLTYRATPFLLLFGVLGTALDALVLSAVVTGRPASLVDFFRPHVKKPEEPSAADDAA